jgi:hypothetical protein
MPDQSYTVNEFCAAERISRAMLYKLWNEGNGPRFYQVGTHRRISHQARIEWQQAMEAAGYLKGGKVYRYAPSEGGAK